MEFPFLFRSPSSLASLSSPDYKVLSFGSTLLAGCLTEEGLILGFLPRPHPPR